MLLYYELFLANGHSDECFALVDICAVVQRHIDLLDRTELAEVCSQVIFLCFDWNPSDK